MSNKTKGSCNCNAVQFEVTSELKDVYICHCSICRKYTGSGGIAVTIASNNDFNWVSGEELIRTWHKPKHDWLCCFCSECGSPLPGKNNENTCYIPVSLLDKDFEGLAVKYHFYVGSKAQWEEIADNGTQFQSGFVAQPE